MNCNEYLALLESSPVAALAGGRAADHAINCANCMRVTRMVAERDRSIAYAYAGVESSVGVPATIDAARTIARRRKVSVMYRIGLGVLFAATLGSIFVSRLFPRKMPGPPVRRETFMLKCVPPIYVMDMIRAERIVAAGKVWSTKDDASRLVNVESTEEELFKVRALLDRIDNATASRCSLP